MAELRRLLIEPCRIEAAQAKGGLVLTASEARYLKRVLRLRPGAEVALIDGCGGLFKASLGVEADLLLSPDRVHTSSSTLSSQPKPSLGLAVALVRRGMDDVMRMACELGVDRFQLLQAQRSVPQAEHRPDRWGVILKEAVEQCERLWAPELLPVLSTEAWWNQPLAEDLGLIAVTRDQGCRDLVTLLSETRQRQCPRRIWIAIGPEGGWTDEELRSADLAGWCSVGLNNTILRSSTAAVAAATLLCSWRESQLT